MHVRIFHHIHEGVSMMKFANLSDDDLHKAIIDTSIGLQNIRNLFEFASRNRITNGLDQLCADLPKHMEILEAELQELNNERRSRI